MKPLLPTILFLITFFTSNGQFWEQKSDFPGTLRHGTASFSLNGYGYVVGGHLSTNLSSNEVWKYDPVADTWSQMDSFPIGIINPNAFVFNDTAYVANGWQTNVGNPNSIVFRYNEAGDSWDSVTVYPGTPGYTMVNFVFNDKVYMGMGYMPYTNEIWQWDPSNNVWTQKADYPGDERQNSTAWVINGRAFAGLGATNFTTYDDIYEYIDSTDTWVSFGAFPGGARYATPALTLNGNVFITCGYDQNNFLNDTWRLDHITMNWTKVEDFGGAPRHSGTSFVINDRAYYGLGRSGTYYSDFWSYEPGNINELRGQAFFDSNGNNVYDSLEAPIKQLLVMVSPGNNVYSTNNNGVLSIPVDTMTNTLSIVNPPAYYTLGLPLADVTIAGNNNIDSSTLIGYIPNGNINDLTVDITSLTPIRFGFQNAYSITYTNLGTVPEDSAIITLILDSSATFGSTTPVQSNYMQQGDTIIFYEFDLMPNETRTFNVIFDVSNVNLGDTILTYVMIDPLSGDQDPLTNADSSSEIVVGSYDPNDKAVNHEFLTPQQVSDSEWLEYLIRFQNTGTYLATYVHLIDSIPAELDLSTFQMISSSHPYTVEINGGRQIYWDFPGINLPDSNANEPGSHGYVKFRIRANNNLVLGDQIHNFAAIYFDFNPAVITNTTETTVISPISLQEITSKNSIVVYPNPASDQIQIRNAENGIKITNIQILDSQGRQIVKRSEYTGKQYRLPELNTGIYLLKIERADGSSETAKFIINK